MQFNYRYTCFVWAKLIKRKVWREYTKIICVMTMRDDTRKHRATGKLATNAGDSPTITLPQEGVHNWKCQELLSQRFPASHKSRADQSISKFSYRSQQLVHRTKHFICHYKMMETLTTVFQLLLCSTWLQRDTCLQELALVPGNLSPLVIQ